MVHEHSFARIIDALGFNHLLQRGKEKVLSECSLIFTIYNLRRSLSILDFKTLLSRIKALKKRIFGHLAAWWSMNSENTKSQIVFTLIIEGVPVRRKVV